MRAPKEHTDEFQDAEASYRRGYQHCAAAVLRALANDLNATTARRFANRVGVDLRASGTLGRAEAQLETPPSPPTAEA
jgi:hypothetical protein